MIDQANTARSIFLGIVEKAPQENWDQLVDQDCGDDLDLRNEVQRLLSAQEGMGSFMDRPAAEAARHLDQLVAEQAGTVIGPYRLLQQIGEGGMGVVFVAEQERPVKRRVALKVIKPGMDTREVIARFEAERQALALMDHPNIAKVYDAGTTDEKEVGGQRPEVREQNSASSLTSDLRPLFSPSSRPYFVMELVQGVPITDYCDECQLTTRERLELFITVCQAVQHAHQKGIIHRDIKPSNVLVAMQDRKPSPKIIDFGVAKAINQQLTEHTLMTAFAQMVGTPLYMSPEQAELSALGVDTRSDIYSLGVLLYELLTSTTPFDRDRFHTASYDEVRRIIREEEPPRPSHRLTTLAADLATTVAEHRRTDTRRLRQAVRGELDWIVMKCLEKDRSRRYDSVGSLARDVERYLRDEPVQACPPSAGYRLKKLIRRNKIAAAFILLLVAGVAALAFSNVQTRRNERRADLATAKAQAVSELLQKMFATSNPDEVKGAEYTVRQLLDDFSAGLGTQLDSQPEVEAEIRATVGRVYWRLGIADAAEVNLKRALALRRRMFGPDHEKVADSLVDYAWNLALQSRHADAESSIREALRIYGARNAAPESIIHAQWSLQRLLISLHKFDDAESVANEALAIARESGGEYPDVANILHALADAQTQTGNYSEAERTAQQAVDLHRRLHGPIHPETAWGLRSLAQPLIHVKKYDEAKAALQEALEIYRQSYGSDHKEAKLMEAQLRKVLDAAGDSAEAETLTEPNKPNELVKKKNTREE